MKYSNETNTELKHKKIGITAFSISILSMFSSFSCIGSLSIGNLLTKLFNVNFNLLSFIGFITSLVLAYKYKNSFLMKQTKVISIIGISLLILLNALSLLHK